MNLKYIAPLYFFVAVLLIVVSGFYDLGTIVYYPYNLIFSIILLVIGFLFGGIAAIIFNRRRTTLNPLRRPTSLITNGPYRFSRNPMYLGMFLMLLGLSFYFGSLASMAVSILFLMMMDYTVVPFEERSMENYFGKDFTKYKQKVRRWI